MFIATGPSPGLYSALNTLGTNFRTVIDDACFDGLVTINASSETPKLALTKRGELAAKRAVAAGVTVRREMLFGYLAEATSSPLGRVAAAASQVQRGH